MKNVEDEEIGQVGFVPLSLRLVQLVDHSMFACFSPHLPPLLVAGLWHTWFDRDLGLSGRVWVRVGNVVAPRLVRIDRALLRISNLAIHLQTAKEREAFVVNKEDHLSPILALEVEKALNGGDKDPPSSDDAEEEGGGDDGGTVAAEDAAAGTDADPSTATSTPATTKDGWTEHQEPALLQVLAHELGVPVESIADFELNLFDCQRATLGGAFGEFLHSSRLDNLASCFMAVTALAEHTSHGLLENDADVAMVVLYDHEEVGSASAVGAASPVLGEAVRRISAALHTGDAWVGDDLYRACARQSLVVSSDQAHAVHPNYASKHEKAHQPKMNQGMVVKRNSNQRYATTPATGLLVREVARRAGLLPPQEFMVRQDCGCGSTIGPVISAATGIRAVDVGCPQVRGCCACLAIPQHRSHQTDPFSPSAPSTSSPSPLPNCSCPCTPSARQWACAI